MKTKWKEIKEKIEKKHFIEIIMQCRLLDEEPGRRVKSFTGDRKTSIKRFSPRKLKPSHNAKGPIILNKHKHHNPPSLPNTRRTVFNIRYHII